MIMVQRVYLSSNPPRLITSKEGKNASPALIDVDKTFDSNWFDGGGLKWILQAAPYGQRLYFPYPLNYTPYVWGFGGGNLWDGSNSTFNAYMFSQQDKPPANDCVFCYQAIQRKGVISTVTNSYIEEPTNTNGRRFTDFWMVFEG